MKDAVSYDTSGPPQMTVHPGSAAGSSCNSSLTRSMFQI